MGNDWKRVVISDVCELIVDCVNKTAPVVETPTPFKMIRTPNIKNGRVNTDSCRYVEENTYIKWTRRAEVRRGDVLLTREAPLGEVGIVNTDEKVFLGQRVMQYRVNSDLLDKDFLLYSFLSSDLQHQFSMHEGSGSVVSHIRVGDCLKFELNLPPLMEQKRISHVLATIDNKIALNRQTNQTLEQMAQTLFKSWFVDFDPVFDNLLAKVDFKLDTSPSKCSSDLGSKLGCDFPDVLLKKAKKRLLALQDRALQQGCDLHALLAGDKNNIHSHFPSEFEFSEQLGWIPKGWEVKLLSDLLEVKYGKDHKKLNNGEFPVYGSGGVMRYAEEYLYSGESVLIPRKGTLSNIMYVNRKFWSVDTMFYTIPKISNIAKFSFYHLNRLDFASMNVGSAVPSMTTKVLNILPIIKPTSTVLKKFDDILAAQFMRIELNEKENQSLTKLRDTLLPKLISGELQIPDVVPA